MSTELFQVLARTDLHPTDRASALRKLFVKQGGLASVNASREQVDDEPYQRAADVPMGEIMAFVRPLIESHREASAPKKPAPDRTTSSLVAAVKAALLSGAFPQDGPGGFSGDPDAFREPVLNAGE